MSETKILFLNQSAIRKFCRERGRRTGSDFLTMLDWFISKKLGSACQVHNGGKKTLDAHVAGFIGIK